MPKSERTPNPEIRVAKCNARVSDFGFRTSFGLRSSDFGFQLRRLILGSGFLFGSTRCLLLFLLFTSNSFAGNRSHPSPDSAGVVFERTSVYHHIRVVEQGGMRILCFDDATESRMSLEDPMKGHFEYTEYFHLPWLWNTQLNNVLMIGLGGASAQRS